MQSPHKSPQVPSSSLSRRTFLGRTITAAGATAALGLGVRAENVDRNAPTNGGASGAEAAQIQGEQKGGTYFYFLADEGMNYTLNRPLMDGHAINRIEEIRAVAPEIQDFDSWYKVWLGLAKRAEAEERWLDAATYYH
jgi:hypothetical protein